MYGTITKKNNVIKIDTEVIVFDEFLAYAIVKNKVVFPFDKILKKIDYNNITRLNLSDNDVSILKKEQPKGCLINYNKNMLINDKVYYFLYNVFDKNCLNGHVKIIKDVNKFQKNKFYLLIRLIKSSYVGIEGLGDLSYFSKNITIEKIKLSSKFEQSIVLPIYVVEDSCKKYFLHDEEKTFCFNEKDEMAFILDHFKSGGFYLFNNNVFMIKINVHFAGTNRFLKLFFTN
jgi:hypothetical protein